MRRPAPAAVARTVEPADRLEELADRVEERAAPAPERVATRVEGGQQDAGSCLMYGQSCAGSQQCCVPLICAGNCLMPVSQDASSDGPKTVERR